MGGSLLVALNAFMKRKMTQNSLQAWRKKGDLHLQNARQPELCERSQTDAAFDACYMYARCIAGEKSELRSHSDTSILVLVAAKLGWHHCVLRPARQHVYALNNRLRVASQFEVLMMLALRLKNALDVPMVSPPKKRHETANCQ